MPEPLLIDHAGPVLRLRMNRPQVHNAFDPGLVAALLAALEAAAVDPGLRAMVLSGQGASFSAGADLQWMRAMATADALANRADALQLARLMRTLDTFPRPTIARVHGATFGGGVGLVACCDIAIGTPQACFGLSEVRLGLLPAVISPYVVAAIGARQARRWFATGETFDATVAQQLGLLHQVVATESLDHAVDAQLALLTRAGPQAAALAKALVRDARRTDSDEQDRANAELIARLRASPEGREGLAAFLEKRDPAWAGASSAGGGHGGGPA